MTPLAPQRKAGSESRTAASENEVLPDGFRRTVWLPSTRPGIGFFVGIWTRWTSVQKVKEGETTNDVFAFLITDRTRRSGRSTRKAMPVVLAAREEIDV